jgi:transposase-like protein
MTSSLSKREKIRRKPHPASAASLEEGFDELFTINRLELSSSLRFCLGTTNIIDSSHSGIRIRTRRVGRWRNGQMVLRWAASAFLATEKGFRRIHGYRDLSMLQAKLNDAVTGDDKSKVA